jgi:hypothetical protein
MCERQGGWLPGHCVPVGGEAAGGELWKDGLSASEGEEMFIDGRVQR